MNAEIFLIIKKLKKKTLFLSKINFFNKLKLQYSKS